MIHGSCLAAVLLLAMPSPRQQAAHLFDQGSVAFQAGRFEEALADFAASYEQIPLPQILFDIAQCHRHLAHWNKAESYYLRYLEANPKAPNGADVARYLIEMRSKLEADAPAFPVAAPVHEAPPPPMPAPQAATVAQEPPPRRLPSGAWWTGGIGTGLAVVGSAAIIGFTVAGAPAPCRSGAGLCSPQTPGQAQTASNLTGGGVAALAVGGALLATAIIWAAVAPRAATRP